MTRRVLLIDHPVGQRDDRASRWLDERGFQVEWCCPGKGDVLPVETEAYDATIVYGGMEDLSVDRDRDYLQAEMAWIASWVSTERPFLGICLGSQLLAESLGGEVGPHSEGLHQIGFFPIAPTASANGFLDGPLHVYQWHKEGFEVPQGAELLATGPDFPNQAFRYGERAYGLQFHPEVCPAVISRWIGEATSSLDAPGAQTRADQFAMAELHDPAMEAWFESFLNRWLFEA